MKSRKAEIAKGSAVAASVGAAGAVAGHVASSYAFCRSYLAQQVDDALIATAIKGTVEASAAKLVTEVRDTIWPHIDSYSSGYDLLAGAGAVTNLIKNSVTGAAYGALKSSANALRTSIADTCMATINTAPNLLRIGAVGAGAGLGLAACYYLLSTFAGPAAEKTADTEVNASKSSSELATIKVRANESAASIVSTDSTVFAVPKRTKSEELRNIIKSNPFNFGK